MLTLFQSSFHTANLIEFLLEFDLFFNLNVSFEDVKLLYKSKKSPSLNCPCTPLSFFLLPSVMSCQEVEGCTRVCALDWISWMRMWNRTWTWTWFGLWFCTWSLALGAEAWRDCMTTTRSPKFGRRQWDLVSAWLGTKKPRARGLWLAFCVHYY